MFLRFTCFKPWCSWNVLNFSTLQALCSYKLCSYKKNNLYGIYQNIRNQIFWAAPTPYTLRLSLRYHYLHNNPTFGSYAVFVVSGCIVYQWKSNISFDTWFTVGFIDLNREYIRKWWWWGGKDPLRNYEQNINAQFWHNLRH